MALDNAEVSGEGCGSISSRVAEPAALHAEQDGAAYELGVAPGMGSLPDTGASRNPIFSTADEFRAAADAYFADCDDCGRLYGEAGLCLWLSSHNPAGRRVTQETLRRWYDGERCAYLQEDVQMAYLRIQDQVETDPRYHNKAMVTRAIFLQKQTRLGGYQDKIEEKNDTTVRIVFGDGVSAETFG